MGHRNRAAKGARLEKLAKEGELVKAVMQLLQAHGFQVFRRNTGATMASYTLKSGETKNRFVRFGVGGMADIWGWQVLTGRHIEVEVKRLGLEPTPLQEQWLRSARDGGAIAFWCDSMGMAEAELASGGAERRKEESNRETTRRNSRFNGSRG